jgi:hypothetical protein
MLVALSIIVILLGLAFAAVIYRLASRVDEEACSPEWLEEFSLERFAPMERLLDPVDIKFVESQPGYHRSIGARLLRERRRAFVGYLDLLTQDFNQLMGVAKLMAVHSSEDRTDFAVALWRQQITFYLAICAVRCRVALYPLVRTGINVGNLVDSMAGLRRQIQELTVPRVQAV